MAVIFSKIKAKNAGIAVATASIFNAEIWKKNNISLSSLSGQSTIISFVSFLYQERKERTFLIVGFTPLKTKKDHLFKNSVLKPTLDHSSGQKSSVNIE